MFETSARDPAPHAGSAIWGKNYLLVSAAIKLAADPGFEVIYLGNARGTGPIGALDVKAADEDVKRIYLGADFRLD